MWRSRSWLAAVCFGVTVFGLVESCYSPSLESCILACASDGSCPDGQDCSHGLCTSESECTETVNTGGSVTQGGAGGQNGTGAETANAGSPNLGGDLNSPPADTPSTKPSISADGRFVAFQSGVKVKRINVAQVELVGTYDIFVRDVETGATRRASLTDSGAQGNNHSENPSISGDGLYVAFTSKASNLVSGDTNGVVDVFVRDLELGTTQRVSVSSDGLEANGESGSPSISADGRYVAFTSLASNLVAGDTNGDEISAYGEDVFVRDLHLGKTVRVSVSDDEAEANDFSRHPSISADGQLVAFESDATNLVTDDENGTTDIFVRDLSLESTQRVSVSDDEGEVGGFSRHPSISAEGVFVAFESNATNLVTDDENGTTDIFVRDLSMKSTQRVSVSESGDEASDPVLGPSISGNGQFVVFGSFASLVASDTNAEYDFFVRDRLDDGSTQRLIASEADEGTSEACISADGSVVALVANAPNGLANVFVVPVPK